jgi:hypothetical protein
VRVDHALRRSAASRCEQDDHVVGGTNDAFQGFDEASGHGRVRQLAPRPDLAERRHRCDRAQVVEVRAAAVAAHRHELAHGCDPELGEQLGRPEQRTERDQHGADPHHRHGDGRPVDPVRHQQPDAIALGEPGSHHAARQRAAQRRRAPGIGESARRSRGACSTRIVPAPERSALHRPRVSRHRRASSARGQSSARGTGTASSGSSRNRRGTL